jgi:hypothetical protein
MLSLPLESGCTASFVRSPQSCPALPLSSHAHCLLLPWFNFSLGSPQASTFFLNLAFLVRHAIMQICSVQSCTAYYRVLAM